MRPALVGKTKDHGTDESETLWAQAEIETLVPMATVVSRLKDFKNFKNTSTQDITAKAVSIPGVMFAQNIDIHMTVALIISLDWTEEWRIHLLAGTQTAPTKVLLQYQKINGTSHIEKFCGSVLLEKIKDKTKISYAEEIKASHRESVEVLNGILDTMGKLGAQ